MKWLGWRGLNVICATAGVVYALELAKTVDVGPYVNAAVTLAGAAVGIISSSS